MIGVGARLSDAVGLVVNHAECDTKAMQNRCVRRKEVLGYVHVVTIFREGLRALNIPEAALLDLQQGAHVLRRLMLSW